VGHGSIVGNFGRWTETVFPLHLGTFKKLPEKNANLGMVAVDAEGGGGGGGLMGTVMRPIPERGSNHAEARLAGGLFVTSWVRGSTRHGYPRPRGVCFRPGKP